LWRGKREIGQKSNEFHNLLSISLSQKDKTHRLEKHVRIPNPNVTKHKMRPRSYHGGGLGGRVIYSREKKKGKWGSWMILRGGGGLGPDILKSRLGGGGEIE